MARRNFLGPVSALVLLGCGYVAAACNGHVSLGSTGDTLGPVATSTAQAETVASSMITCASGSAHPNICCEAGESTATACGTWDEEPFRKCETGWTTYPDLTKCCDLKDPASCTTTSAGPSSGGATSAPSNPSSPTTGPSGGTTTPASPPAYGCGFACPPGWWSQAVALEQGASPTPACCTEESGSVLECVPQGPTEAFTTPACAGAVSGDASSTMGVAEDAGVASPPPPNAPGAEDAGGGVVYPEDDGCYYDDAGTGYDPGYDGGAASLCGVCPTGWSANDPLQPELCCQTNPDGTFCFSQATGSATTTDGGTSGVNGAGSSSSNGGSGSTNSGGTVTVDASVGDNGASWANGSAPTTDGGIAAPSCYGSASACSCEETVGGHSYTLDCYAGTAVSCTCAIDGKATNAVPTVDSCEDSTAVVATFTAASGCTFP